MDYIELFIDRKKRKDISRLLSTSKYLVDKIIKLLFWYYTLIALVLEILLVNGK